MGKIRGDVNVLGIANLLQFLSANKREGVLTVFRNEEKKSIYVTEAGMRLIATTKRKVNSLGEILVRTKRITRVQLVALLEEQKSSGKRLGEIVARLGIVSKADIETALREQVAEEVYDLFAWADSTFEFNEGRVLNPEGESPLAELMLDWNITSLMLEAARRTDELILIRKVIPDAKMIPIRQDKEPALEDPNIDREVVESLLPLLDGKLTVKDLVENTLYPEFQVLRALYVLATQGVIRIVDRRGAAVLFNRERPSAVGKPVARSAAKRTILVVSDMPTFRETLAVSLRHKGFDIVEDESGANFAEVVRRVRMDAAILDISVETSDARSICLRFREASRVPFLVLSANTSREAVVEAIQVGARDYIVKPFKDELLMDRLRAVFK